MNCNLLCLAVLPGVIFTVMGLQAGVRKEAHIGNVRPTGPVGERLERMINNHLYRTDAVALAAPFQEKCERTGLWQTEFWGKFMHSAVPFAEYVGNAAFQANIDAGVDAILASQEPCGYIGNYPDELRCGEGWDVWGIKYTMMGLLHYYDWSKSSSKVEFEKGNAVLAACCRLCDYVIGEIGPEGKRGRELWQTGNWSGYASSSILEPVVWLYRRTKEKKYLDFAEYIVKGMTEPESGPRLVDLALKGVSVADRNGYGNDPECGRHWRWKDNRWKAYEMMSCYQGLLEYWEMAVEERRSPRDDLLKAAIASADDIIREEINIAGGCSSSEGWYHGAGRQHVPYTRLQETCVITTWMRLLEKPQILTGDPKYTDEFEKTFYNAYLASMNGDGSEFAAYTPLNGCRSSGHHHCWMHTNCCNANGPRGFLAFLRTALQTEGETLFWNLYCSGCERITLPATGREVVFESYAGYPRDGFVRLQNRTERPCAFTLALRIPAWSAKTRVKVNGTPVDTPVGAGGYFRLARTWATGDVVEIVFDMAVRVHTADHFVAFSRGPIALARDSRFGDGALDEPFRPACRNGLDPNRPPAFVPDRIPDGGFWMAFAVSLPIGEHHENPEGRIDRTVRFCDFASAGNRWETANAYRTWFPVEWSPHEK